MKKFKLMAAAAALTFSTAAVAMPEQVHSGWWSQMMFRLSVMAENPGFCRSNNSSSWIC